MRRKEDVVSDTVFSTARTAPSGSTPSCTICGPPREGAVQICHECGDPRFITTFCLRCRRRLQFTPAMMKTFSREFPRNAGTVVVYRDDCPECREDITSSSAFRFDWYSITGLWPERASDLQ
jgi:hypothetical protein